MRPDSCPPAATMLPQFRQVREYNELAARSGLSQKAEIVLQNGLYWLRKEEQCEGPYCPACYEQDDVTMRLVAPDRICICPRCGKVPDGHGSNRMVK